MRHIGFAFQRLNALSPVGSMPVSRITIFELYTCASVRTTVHAQSYCFPAKIGVDPTLWGLPANKAELQLSTCI